MRYNIPKYYRYVILFKGEIEDVEPIIKVSNLSELKSINKGRMHLFDEELLSILPAIEYCFHMPRTELDTYDTDTEVLDKAYDVSHDIVIVPERLVLSCLHLLNPTLIIYSVGFVEVPEFFLESVQEQTREEMAESIEDGDEIIDLGDDRETVLAEICGSKEVEVQDTSGQDVQKQKPEVEITLTVAECGEFHNMGELYENIPTVDEAIALFEKIPPERMNGIPAIGINLHRAGEDAENDIAIDLVGTKSIDLDVLQYVPDIANEPKAMEVVAELIAKLPDREIDGNLSPELEAKVWEIRMPQLSEEEKLAVEFDRLWFDYDRILYGDSVRSMTENVEELTQEIKTEGTERISDILREIVTEGVVPEEVERAKELLDKLSEYKPLAKVEEVEEQNYNMIDNVLNNGAEKAKKEADRKEMEKPHGRVSLKERLAEKKAMITGNDKAADAQENVKKNQREM